MTNPLNRHIITKMFSKEKQHLILAFLNATFFEGREEQVIEVIDTTYLISESFVRVAACFSDPIIAKVVTTKGREWIVEFATIRIHPGRDKASLLLTDKYFRLFKEVRL